MLKVLAIFRRNLILLGVSRYASPLTSDEMSFRIRRITACLLALSALGLGVERVVAESPRMLAAPPDKDALRRTGHDAIDVSPAVKRYAGIVTALGAPDEKGSIYSFRAARLPAAPGYATNELRTWRLTVLAGKRFSSVFEVQSNSESEIVVTARDGPVNGLAVGDVFVVEEIAIERQGSSSETWRSPVT